MKPVLTNSSPHPLPAWVAGVRWLTLGFILFLGLVFVWADRGSLPAPILALYAFPYGDKAGHFVLYGILTFLVSLSFPQKRVKIGKSSILAGSLWILALAALEECSQAFFAARSASLSDLAFSWLGVIAGVASWAASRIH